MTLSILFLALSLGSASAAPKPKYGPAAQPIAQPLSVAPREYFAKNPAPDFWALIPYYVPQQDDAACSLATVAPLVNAARVGRVLTSDDELATQAGLLKKVRHPAWRYYKRQGITLAEMGDVAPEALKAYGVEGATVKVVHANVAGDGTLEKFKEALAANEKSARDFMLANFVQKAATDDSSVGHFAMLAAYDAATGRVLVLDPDRTWYEPYWIAADALYKGMDTFDSVSSRKRGWVYVTLPATAVKPPGT